MATKYQVNFKKNSKLTIINFKSKKKIIEKLNFSNILVKFIKISKFK